MPGYISFRGEGGGRVYRGFIMRLDRYGEWQEWFGS